MVIFMVFIYTEFRFSDDFLKEYSCKKNAAVENNYGEHINADEKRGVSS